MKKVKGFTLIELIAVISIITILSAILVPNVLTYIEKSHEEKAKSIGSLVFSSAMESYMRNNVFKKDDVYETLMENLKINNIAFEVKEPSDDYNIDIVLRCDNKMYEVEVDGKSDTYIFKKE